jgi:phosphoribosylanthranilate isomerase
VGGAAATWIRVIGGARKVGVFRDQDPQLIRRVREDGGLDLVQLHGHETPELCAELGGREKVIKAIPVDKGTDWGLVAAYGQVARVLFDTGSPSGGGTGRPFDRSRLAGVPPDLAFWLAGGLTPENVARAVAEVRPAGVDVATGVEAAVGRKDLGKMRAFIAAVRGSTGRHKGVQA